MTATSVGAAVTVAYVHSTEVAYSWHQSMMDAFAYDLGGHARMARGGRLAVRYGGYAWGTNMGYGTADHLAALGLLGPTPHHRAEFSPVAQLRLL